MTMTLSTDWTGAASSLPQTSRQEHSETHTPTYKHTKVPCHLNRRAFFPCELILCGLADFLFASGLEFTDCWDRLPQAGNTCCYCKRRYWDSGQRGVVLKYKCNHRENMSKELHDPKKTLKWTVACRQTFFSLGVWHCTTETSRV